MELFQQFLLAEEILNKIINEVKEHTKATFKEVSSALGDSETSAGVDAVIEESGKKDEETVLLLSKPVLNQKRKIKTSIHSTRCEHSPLNRSKISEKSDTYKSPIKLFNNSFMLKKHSKSSKNSLKQAGLTSVAQSNNVRDQKDHGSHSSNMKHLVSADITDYDPLDKQVSSIVETKSNLINENEFRGNMQMSIQRLSEKKRKLPMDSLDSQPPVKRTSCNEAMPTSESKCNIEGEGSPKDEQLLNLTVCLSHAPPIANGSSTTVKSSSLKSVTSVSNSPTTAQQKSVNDNSKTFVGKSPFTDLSNIQNGPCPSTFSSGVQTKHIPRLSAPRTDKKITLFENKTINSFGKSRLFSSAERLGGVSRLNSLNQSVQASKPKTGSRLNSINEKSSINTSLSSYSNKTKDRSASVLSEKEQRLEAKRQAFIEQMEKREERLRAFQDAQKQKIEARKKANEERFLAVQQRYQQMIQGSHQVKENPCVTSMQPNNIGAKPLQITTLPKKCVVNLNPLDHNTLKVQNKPVTTIKQPQPESCQKPQPISKPNTIQPVKQLQTQEKVVVTQKVSLINSPVVR
ncbi:retinal guanylyl cyclase 2 [Schistosoma japonicum]|nr:retinal guanylyl cyclase 2 [Schistosoma japonicum]